MEQKIIRSITKKRRIIISVIVIAFAATLLSQPAMWLCFRLYSGDRITINMHITVNGKPAKIINNKNDFDLIHKKDYTVLSAKADDYDNYEYDLLIENGDDKSIPLDITVCHWDWWEIMKSDLYIDIDTKTSTYKTHEKYMTTAENPLYHISIRTEPEREIKIINKIEINAGSKG